MSWYSNEGAKSERKHINFKLSRNLILVIIAASAIIIGGVAYAVFNGFTAGGTVTINTTSTPTITVTASGVTSVPIPGMSCSGTSSVSCTGSIDEGTSGTLSFDLMASASYTATISCSNNAYITIGGSDCSTGSVPLSTSPTPLSFTITVAPSVPDGQVATFSITFS